MSSATLGSKLGDSSRWEAAADQTLAIYAIRLSPFRGGHGGLHGREYEGTHIQRTWGAPSRSTRPHASRTVGSPPPDAHQDLQPAEGVTIRQQETSGATRVYHGPDGRNPSSWPENRVWVPPAWTTGRRYRPGPRI